jgi:SMI1-KNR4 cell-wall
VGVGAGGVSRNFVAELARLVGLAPQARVAIDWATVEGELGRRLPSDYKEFGSRFGPGNFQGDYLWVAVPRGIGDRVNFLNSLVQNLEILRYLRSSGREIPYPIYPEKGGLISWGDTIDGDVFCWNTEPDDPDHWTVVANEVRTSNWWGFDESMTQFLHSVLTGRIDLPFFPQDLGSAPYSFARAKVGPEL